MKAEPLVFYSTMYYQGKKFFSIVFSTYITIDFRLFSYYKAEKIPLFYVSVIIFFLNLAAGAQ